MRFSDNSGVSQNPDQSRIRSTIWIIITVILTFLVWATFANLDEIVRGSGRVVPRTKTQIVQNLEGGIVQQIFVTEGDIVEPAQRIAKMDETKYKSAFRELQEQQFALLIKADRLRAEHGIGEDFVPSPILRAKASEYAESEIALFRARRSERRSSVDNMTQALRLQNNEVDILLRMAEKNAVPAIDVVRAKQKLVDAQTRLSAFQSEFETKRSQEYSEVLVQLRQIEEQMLTSEDQLARTNVLSPVRGIVNKINATTLGGVVRPGDAIAEILPLDEPLQIEGRVDPRDIGFVFTGMPATIKLTAFDFSIYGTLSGNVVHVGADTVIDESERDAVPYYEVYVKLNQTELIGPAGVVDIRPGMLAEIELRAGQKTVIRYLLKPLFKASQALTER